MKMTDLLEKDREDILSGIAQAGTAAKAVTILENETDKLLLRYNDSCESDREREAAAYMMQAVRLSLPMIDSAGKTKVWERGTDKQEKEAKSLFIQMIQISILPALVSVLMVQEFKKSSVNLETDKIKRRSISSLIARFQDYILWNP